MLQRAGRLTETKQQVPSSFLLPLSSTLPALFRVSAPPADGVGEDFAVAEGRSVLFGWDHTKAGSRREGGLKALPSNRTGILALYFSRQHAPGRWSKSPP